MSRAIRLTPTQWYVAILTLTLGVFSSLFYLNVATHVAQDIDKTLALQADGVADTVFAFWRAERAEAGFGPGNWTTAPSETFEGEISQGGLSSLLNRWAQKTGNLDTERAVCFLDKTGQRLGASPSFLQLGLPLVAVAMDQAEKGQTAYQTVTTPNGRIRVVTRPIMAKRWLLYGVQVAAGLKEADASLARLRLWLIILIPSMLGMTSAVGWVLTMMAKKPIIGIIMQSQRFIAEYLHERVEVPQARNELERLDATFNEMLTRLERALRRLRQFSAAASHELRTPLTVMKGEVGLALRKPRSGEEYRRVLRTHLEAIDELAGTVDELLMLAQTDAVEGETTWCPVELAALAQRLCQSFETLAEAKAIRVEAAVNGPVWVPGERRLLERLISNLLDNAIRHTPSKGRVMVMVERREDQAVLVVQDTGLGIPPEVLPHLFDQFFRRRPSRHGARSTGLGLGLCRWIVETHRGRLEVASPPGQGATFTIRLPLSPPPAGS